MAKQTKGSTKKKKTHSKGFSTFLSSLRGFFFTLLSLFLVGFLAASAIGGYFFTNVYATVTGDVMIDLTEEKKNQSLTTIIYAYQTDKDGKTTEVEYARLHGEENRVWIDLDLQDAHVSNEKGFKLTPEMSKYSNIINAYVALEDKRFWEHSGVDWRRFIGVVTKYSFSQGASTLTQQLIKNITKEKDVTAVRKYREILTALNMERNYSKDVIVEAYLNTLYLGRGCYGIRTGAEKYFGKEVSEMNLAECASLAAITKAPNEFDPLSNPENNKTRQEYCLSEMLSQGLITQEEYDEAVAYQIIYTNSTDYKPKPGAAEKPQSEINNYYVDYIIDTVIADLVAQQDMSKADATKKLYSGGLKIYAAVDMNAQEILEDVYRKRTSFPNIKATEKQPAPQSSMTIMDYEGRVVAICGGADEKTRNRSLNRAAASWRQPGSTIKPLAVYGPALDKDLITWSTMMKNSAFPYMGMNWPKNNDGTLGSGADVTIQVAVQRSLNTVSARTLNEKLKIDASYTFLDESFGFTKLDPVNDRYLPPLATGGMTYGFSTLEECAAFATFGSGGMYYEPFCYYKVTNNTGSEILLKTDESTQVIKRAFTAGGADVMCEMLQTVSVSAYYGSNDKYIKKFQVFSKTGTTSDNKDRWFAAGTPYYVGSVWFGYDQPKDLGSMTNPAGQIWMEVMNRIHKDLDPAKKFPKSDEAVKKSFCTRTGKIAGPSCPSATGWYKVSNVPGVCTVCGAAAPTPATPTDSTGG
ncbi:MAG: transglycosylase domain-containing protein, partial [Oscillospiraceae bacterium]|nr:transglycosylase domain-containing protein [Oscillospiraceae bacterium]